MRDTSAQRAPLIWQRTDTVGTELVFPVGNDPRAASGSAVIAGPVPHTKRWHAELDADAVVRDLTVTCEGGDWNRTLRLARDPEHGWTCRTEETGDLDGALTDGGHRGAPLPGIDDSTRLHPDAIIRLSDSPIFLTWALRRLRLAAGDRAVAAPTIRILTPSLVVLPGVSTYQLVSEHRLRVSGDEPASGYELDDDRVVTYQPARLRLAH
ncbi:putative glycolipid-binding domain-containing protein [Actinoplanes sp. NPDC048791]|uniref:putative glycolipid-binding domain-containing protein n=1 Tax=Actinoplanes sp. NPDC048791 TaxID=3154623 RepID=UPI0033CFB734